MPKPWLSSRRRTLWLGLATLASIGVQNKGRARVSLVEQTFEEGPQKINKASLRESAAKKKLIYGAAVRPHILSSDRQFSECVAQECGILVPVNELKWKILRPSPDKFDFTKADHIQKYAQNHNMLFRGHTLVWHNFLPPWFDETVNRRNAEQMLVNHIKTVAEHYAGQMHSWDVVNEGIAPHEGRSDGLRITPWLELLGPDYIDLAFRVAAEADPQAMLVYNDNSLDYNIPKDEAKREAVLQLLYRLKAIGTPIHALGIQAHLRARETRFSAAKLKDFLRHVGSLDLKILITEMDVSDQGLPQDIETRDRIVAQVYYDYLSVVLSEPAVIGVLTWGLSDRYTWLSNHRPRGDGAPVRPLPLDRNLQRKPAWTAIARAFDAAPMRL